ncbi:MAG TPA: cellulase family glycosylhydrolase [Candidatus Binatia bacterium]|nr:cellulase family glycosylhydrolase [Candidatus Binatia bacterium]
MGGAPRLRLLALSLPVAIAAWVAMPVPTLSASVPPPDRPTARAGLPWLSTRDGAIVASSGEAVMLHGFDDENLLPRSQTVSPAPLDATDARLMQESGFDVVRLPIAWSELEPEPGEFNSAYLERIAAAVALLNAHRLYVVLDMHFLAWSPVYGGAGAPAWATLGWVPDFKFGQSGNTVLRLASPALNASEAYFFLTSGWQSQLLRTWQFVAQRFRGDSGVAGYDIFNEAHSFPLLPLSFDRDQLFPFYARAVTAIAAVDPNHLFFLENDALDDLPTAVVPIKAPDIVYSPHVYTGVLSPALGGEPQALDTHVAELAGEAAQLSAPMWVGEFGDGSNHPSAAQWITDALDAYDAHDAGWAWWQWRGVNDPWSLRSATGTSLNVTFLRLLARPYLAAAPRGVSASAGDGVLGRLDISVAARHATGVIEVAWSEYTLGQPSVASSCGATSSWDASDARLLLTVPADGTCSIQLAAG